MIRAAPHNPAGQVVGVFGWLDEFCDPCGWALKPGATGCPGWVAKSRATGEEER
jgi:hypothetical protein